MKILPIQTISNQHIKFMGKSNKTSSAEERKVVLYSSLEAAAIMTVGIGMYNYWHSHSYLRKLADGLEKITKNKVKVNQLKSVMNRREMLRMLPKLKKENYIASPENIKNGTFCADLHSHSNFSDGKMNVTEILDQAAKYGDKLAKINGKKFIFALTDHDGVKGVAEALEIISKNPEKFKNVKFIPAAELSFVMPRQKNCKQLNHKTTTVEMPEMLILGINPFSEASNKFFDNLYAKRASCQTNAIAKAKSMIKDMNFSIDEFENTYSTKQLKNKYCMLNQHWKINDYLKTKIMTASAAKSQNVEADMLYKNLCQEFKLAHKDITPYNFENYFKKKQIELSCQDELLQADKICNEIFPKKLSETEVSSPCENTFDDIVKLATKDKCLLGLAHPGYTMQNLNQNSLNKELQHMINHSNGRLKFAESYHQNYKIEENITLQELENYNRVIDDVGLINIGGRDNHKGIFIE